MRLDSEQDTAVLRRLLLEPDFRPAAEELAGEMQHMLWTCLQVRASLTPSRVSPAD